MTAPIPCPSCQTPLRLPAGGRTASYTCPRCLAEIPAAPADARPEPGPPPAPTPDGRCVWCEAVIPSGRWLYCPSCSGPLRASDAALGQDALEADVARDGRRTGWFGYLLLGLGGISLAVVGLGALHTRELTALFLLGLAILTAVVWGVVYYRTRNRPGERTARRVVRGVVLTVGAVVFGYFALAVVVIGFLCVVCLANGERGFIHGP